MNGLGTGRHASRGADVLLAGVAADARTTGAAQGDAGVASREDDAMLRTVLGSVLEAGAHRAHVIREAPGGFVLEARASSEDAIEVGLDAWIDAHAAAPIRLDVVREVFGSGERVLVPHPSDNGNAAHAAGVREPRAFILCMPVRRDDSARAVLYLECDVDADESVEVRCARVERVVLPAVARAPLALRSEAIVPRNGRALPAAETPDATVQDLMASVPDALVAHIAIVDAAGTVVAVNAAWRDFAATNGFPDAGDGVGWNYLAVCDVAQGAGAEWARAAAAGIRDVAAGRRPAFHLEYPCSGHGTTHWFQMRVTPLTRPGWLVVAHESISEIKSAQQQLAGALARLSHVKERLQAENVYLRGEIEQSQAYGEIVGGGDAMRAVAHRIEQVAPTDVTVLVVGETGTGKELVARAIHAHSMRRERPLVTVNCAVLPATLIESELFGHERGAFTGAIARKIGRFELAHGGTIVLDEIGELPLELQVKLLRVLQEREFERLGSPTTHHVDVRVVASTNRNLKDAIAEGTFRSDLYYRLLVFPIELPPLRARLGDIPVLVRHFVRKHEGSLGKRIEHIPKPALDALSAYAWPGNVRELENVIERAIILSPSSTLRVDDALGEVGEREASSPSDRLADVERIHIRRVIEDCGGRIKGRGGAAERLGLKPSTLRSRMQRLRLLAPYERVRTE